MDNFIILYWFLAFGLRSWLLALALRLEALEATSKLAFRHTAHFGRLSEVNNHLISINHGQIN